MLYRHGDVLIQKVRKVPADAKKARHVTLAEGEVTGHSHRIKEKDVAQMHILNKDRFNEVRYLTVSAEIATLIHEEHASIELKKGIYKVWRQREYTPERIITVRD